MEYTNFINVIKLFNRSRQKEDATPKINNFMFLFNF